jgi:uncharacterized protein (UPF0147 family)
MIGYVKHIVSIKTFRVQFRDTILNRSFAKSQAFNKESVQAVKNQDSLSKTIKINRNVSKNNSVRRHLHNILKEVYTGSKSGNAPVRAANSISMLDIKYQINALPTCIELEKYQGINQLSYVRIPYRLYWWR